MRREYSGAVGQGGWQGPSVYAERFDHAARERDGSVGGPVARSGAAPLRGDDPRHPVRVPKTIVHVAPRPMIAPGGSEEEESVVRGDVAGDFLATSAGGTYRIGRVSGNVKILTHSGEIHVASAGAGADLKTYGGTSRSGRSTGT
jgi:hypothetical protein